ncbi:MAG: hypothetical protein JRH10_22170 [Deltaproteobacteria bacterium]|nr:hypothetical protein [Deltaproteobacteria bacterium]
MNDRPTSVDLLRTVERFLEEQVVGQLQGPARFHARVAANVVAIVAREIETEDAHSVAEWARLGSLLEDTAEAPTARDARHEGLRARNEALVERIRAGDADAGPFAQAVLAHLRATVDEKMEVSKPPRVGRERR